MRFTVLSFFLLLTFVVGAQPTFPYNGVRPKDVTMTALVNATIITSPGETIEKGTLLVDKGKVVAVGTGLEIPMNAVVYDMTGMFIYPAFIDVFSDYGIPKAPPQERMRRGAQAESTRKGAFGWNDAIKADQRAAQTFQPNDEQASELRSLGFGAVVSHQQDGIVRGTGALVQLGGQVNEAMLVPELAAFYSFNKGTSTQDYPSSLMGSIALLRQTYYDAQWYADGGKEIERNLSLEDFNRIKSFPAFFDAGEKWNVFRADKVGDEFKIQYIIKGSGAEYQRIADVVATKASFVIPLNFPAAYDVSDPLLARWVEYGELKHWEMAPFNASILKKNNVRFAFTASGLMEKKDFLKNLRKAVKSGLSKEDALAALTVVPAEMIKTEQTLGRLKPGYLANFIVTSEDVFSDKAVIYENWISGKKFEINARPKEEFKNGKYELVAKDINVFLEKEEKTKAFVLKDKEGGMTDTLTFQVKFSTELNFLNLMLSPDSSASAMGLMRFSGWRTEKGWKGKMEMKDGNTIDAQLVEVTLKEKQDKKNDLSSDIIPDSIGAVVFPFTAFGFKEMPKQENVLIINATIWTNDKEGKIENGQLLISNGKIAAVGKTVSTGGVSNLITIDGKGKHVTAGIIDEHSHIALASVNEGSQASSAEVKESSVIWPEDIDIYRQLSGGVTASQLLHGSANPIGGQSALIKMRWGANADDMLINGADGFIKFALGENVKQSNWGDFNTTRFPQTRMGVEQVYYDHFIRAREYAAEWKNYLSNSGKKKTSLKMPRRDLELDALAEILAKQRFITCHSYVQSEINMLMHVADSMGFKINTFTHILEGYKIADKMAAHGAGGSSFSDWWAYKMEVKDAIPYNGALMWNKGITVAFNSDDAEMARRLNQEAAKAVKYGNVPEEEALKFVTLNPAKLLHLDKRMGSLTVGKDADVVLWSDHPLSVYAKAEMTFVDGIRYYDAERDKSLRIEMEQERARIIQKMIKAKDSGEPTMTPSYKSRKHFHCDTMDETSQGVYFKEN